MKVIIRAAEWVTYITPNELLLDDLSFHFSCLSLFHGHGFHGQFERLAAAHAYPKLFKGTVPPTILFDIKILYSEAKVNNSFTVVKGTAEQLEDPFADA